MMDTNLENLAERACEHDWRRMWHGPYGDGLRCRKCGITDDELPARAQDGETMP